MPTSPREIALVALEQEVEQLRRALLNFWQWHHAEMDAATERYGAVIRALRDALDPLVTSRAPPTQANLKAGRIALIHALSFGDGAPPSGVSRDPAMDAFARRFDAFLAERDRDKAAPGEERRAYRNRKRRPAQDEAASGPAEPTPAESERGDG